MNVLDRTEQIDNYLLDKMSPAEKKQFEQLLAEDASNGGDLNRELLLQKDLIHEIQKKGLKKQLQAREKQIKNNRRILTWTSASFGSLAVAAVLIVLLVVVPLSRMLFDYSTNFISQRPPLESVRGNQEEDAIQYNLWEIYKLMTEDKWTEAEQLIESTQVLMSTIQDKQHLEEQETIDWQIALCYMHNGKTIKAIQTLRQIAHSESAYNDKAQKILDLTLVRQTE